MKNKHAVGSLLITLGLAGGVIAQDIPTVNPAQLAELGQLKLPTDVDIGAGGRIYVVDSGNHQIAMFDSSFSRIASFGERGGERGQLEKPVGIGVSRTGEVYVADKGNQRVQMFDADGKLRRIMDLEEDGEKASPVDVAVSRSGKELFITTNNSHRVLVYSDKGDFLRGWGGEGEEPGKFRFPATIVVDHDDNVFVVDVLNNRVQKFDTDGNVLATIGTTGGKPGTFFRPKGIAIDSAGYVYVSDSYLGAVQVFNSAGEFLHVLGAAGVTRIFETPVGMAARGNRLLITEMLPGKVQVVAPEAVP